MNRLAILMLLGINTLICPPLAAQSVDPAVLNANVQNLQREVTQQRLDFEKRIDASQVQLRLFVILLGGLGTLGTLIGGAFAFTSWYTGRKDYLSERQFYEKRIGDVTLHQIGLGKDENRRSDEMLTKQIETIVKLGAVIDVVQKSFEMQLSREDSMKNVSEIVQSLTAHFTEAYLSAKKRITSLRISRMDWASMSQYQAAVAAGARADFSLVPESVIKREVERDACDFARICQLLGTSAFYANDVALAESLLGRSRSTYKAAKDTVGHRDPMAATSYFMGLIAKNWLKENQKLEDGLTEAKQYLEEANTLLKDKDGEFLVPITLGELQSYIDSEQSQAALVLDANIAAIEHRGASIDQNQRKLLIRAYVVRANLQSDHEARQTYKKALGLNPKHAYATLSLAFKTSEADERRRLFSEGLGLLESTGAIEKTEITSRGTALAWAIIAAFEIGDDAKKTKFKGLLDSLRTEAVSTGGRVPLFFCPLTRTVTLFDRLLDNIQAHVG